MLVIHHPTVYLLLCLVLMNSLLETTSHSPWWQCPFPDHEVTPIRPPWLAVLFLYLTLPKCNLLKHALTSLEPKTQPENDAGLFLSFSDVHPDCTPCPVGKILTRENALTNNKEVIISYLKVVTLYL